MHLAHDFERFRSVLDQVCSTWDRPPAKDDLVKAYWEALKDITFAEFERNAKQLMRLARAKTPWPKPGDFRDRPEEQGLKRTANMEADARMAEERSQRNWDELREKDPELFALEIGIARCGLILARDRADTPQYGEARTLDFTLRERRRALLKERAAQ